VLRSEWPNIPEAELVERCRSWARANGCRVVVVFDGQAPGGLVGEEAVGPECEVVGTGAESADDWLRRAASHCCVHGRTYWLVTSDRALRATAGKRAERIIGGGTFARELPAVA
jgi:predicted RNA-binding protein with PIN domain